MAPLATYPDLHQVPQVCRWSLPARHSRTRSPRHTVGKGTSSKQIRAKSLAGTIISGVEVPELWGPVRFLIAVSIVSATMYRNAAWGSVPCLSKSLGGE